MLCECDTKWSVGEGEVVVKIEASTVLLLGKTKR